MKSFLKTGPALVLAAIVWLGAGGLVFGQSSTEDAVPVLEGLDPVMLVQGKEVQGNFKITTTRGRFQYLFANAENRTTFEKDPQRYEIQLDGACARMGPGVAADPDLYTVYKGHIYAFGSDNCLKMFKAAPESFIEAQPTITGASATPDALRQGLALIEKAVAALGGEKKLDSLKSYREQGKFVSPSPAGQSEDKTNLTIIFPDRIRRETTRSFGTLVSVVSPAESFASFDGRANPMRTGARRELEKQELQRTVVGILRMRKSANFRAVASGQAKSGDVNLEQVAVAVDDLNLTLGIDATTGRILTLAFHGRGANGAFGDIVESFGDFRTVDGLSLPFKTDTTWNGQPMQSLILDSISVNGDIDPSVFEKPKPKPAQ
jgi:YHS domain-containing protein